MKPNRETLHIRIPPELLESLKEEAEFRKATLTAVVEERLGNTRPLHDKLDEALRLLRRRR